MRSKRWAATLLAASALVAVPVAAAGMMHPTLGARLSGMGEHGIVNLHANATTPTLHRRVNDGGRLRRPSATTS